MKPRTCMFLIVFLIVLGNYLGHETLAQGEHSTVQGPLLMGSPVGGDAIAFQDFGSQDIWKIKMPNSSYNIHSWSPDGCYVLLRDSDRWKLLSVTGDAIKEISPSSPVGQLSTAVGLIWTPSGKALTFSIRDSSSETRIYSVDVSTLATELILKLDKTGRALQWLSETELLYETEEGYFVWDSKTEKSREYQQLYQIPSDWASEVYLSFSSPNGELLARYYSLISYKSLTSGTSDNASSVYEATIESITKEPGFDIHFWDDGLTKHIDVMGQFLQSLEWSPSSESLVVSTYPLTTPDNVNGIYVYDLRADALHRIRDFPALLNAEYGQYFPSWSSDSNWLAFNTPSGYIAYNLMTQETIKLSEQFNNSYMSLFWSPIIDYSNSDCG